MSGRSIDGLTLQNRSFRPLSVQPRPKSTTRPSLDMYIARPRPSMSSYRTTTVLSGAQPVTVEPEIERSVQVLPVTQQIFADSSSATLAQAKGGRSQPSWTSILTLIVSVVVLVIATASAYDTWRQNQQLHDKVTTARTSPESADREGTDESKVTSSDLDNYIVSADMPRILRIPSLDVNARVMRMGITDGRIQAPESIWDTGWYDGSAKPGEKGTTFIDGHVSGPSQPAIFEKLDTLTTGDHIEIERGDGSLLKYSVKTVETVSLNDVDMRRILNAASNEGLVIMTCGGNYLGNYQYDSRIVVQATRIK